MSRFGDGEGAWRRSWFWWEEPDTEGDSSLTLYIDRGSE